MTSYCALVDRRTHDAGVPRFRFVHENGSYFVRPVNRSDLTVIRCASDPLVGYYYFGWKHESGRVVIAVKRWSLVVKVRVMGWSLGLSRTGIVIGFYVGNRKVFVSSNFLGLRNNRS